MSTMKKIILIPPIMFLNSFYLKLILFVDFLQDFIARFYNFLLIYFLISTNHNFNQQMYNYLVI